MQVIHYRINLRSVSLQHGRLILHSGYDLRGWGSAMSDCLVRLELLILLVYSCRLPESCAVLSSCCFASFLYSESTSWHRYSWRQATKITTKGPLLSGLHWDLLGRVRKSTAACNHTLSLPSGRPKKPHCCWCLWWVCVSCHSECGTVWYWPLLQNTEQDFAL